MPVPSPKSSIFAQKDMTAYDEYCGKLSQQIKLAKSFINVLKIFIPHDAFIHDEKFYSNFYGKL